MRKWSRTLHRDLSFFFAGMILVYAISGIALNHRRSFNVNYSVEVKELPVDMPLPADGKIAREKVVEMLERVGEQENYTKHYFPAPDKMKVFLKGGSNVVVDFKKSVMTYEKLSQRPVLSSLAFLHFSVDKWWVCFSDIFAGALIIITLTGFIMLKGRKGIWTRAGIELALGFLIPLLFILILR